MTVATVSRGPYSPPRPQLTLAILTLVSLTSVKYIRATAGSDGLVNMH